jgi:hypothetical protein
MASIEDVLANVPTIEQVVSPGGYLPAPQPGEATGTGNWLTAGVGSGVYGGLADLGQGAQAVGQAVGANDFAQSAADWAARQRATAATYARPDLESAPWYSPTAIAYRTAQGLPQMAAMMGGAALAGAALPADLTVAGGGLAAALARKGLPGLAAAATRAAPEGLSALLTRGGLARIAGAGAAAYPFQVGENIQRAQTEGQPVDQAAADKALALGIPEAALQGIFPAFGEATLGGVLGGRLGGGALSRAVKGAGIGAAIQVPVGAAGEALLQQMGDPNRDFAQRSQDVINAALSGGIQGALLGGLIHGISKKPPAKVSTPEIEQAVDEGLNGATTAPPAPPAPALPAPGTPGTEPPLPPPQRYPPGPPEPMPGRPPLSGEVIQGGGQGPLELEGPPRPAGELPAPPPPQIGEQRRLPSPLWPLPDETTERYKARLASIDNQTLLHHAQIAGPDDMSGKAALEVLADRLNWPANDSAVPTTESIRAQIAAQDAAAAAQGQKQAVAEQQTQRIKQVTRGFMPDFLKPHLGDEQAVKTAIFMEASRRDEAGQKLGTRLTGIAKDFGVLGDDGQLVDPRPPAPAPAPVPEPAPAVEVAKPPAPAPAPVDNTPTRVTRDAIPDVHKAKWDALEDLRGKLPDNLNHLLPQIDEMQSKLANPKRGEVQTIAKQTRLIREAIDGAKAVDNVKPATTGEPTQTTEQPVAEKPPAAPSDKGQTATKFDTSLEREVPPVEQTQTEPPQSAWPASSLDYPIPPTPGETSKQKWDRGLRNSAIQRNAEKAAGFGASDAAQRAYAEFLHGRPEIRQEFPQPKMPRSTRPSNERGPQVVEPQPLPAKHVRAIGSALRDLRTNIGQLMNAKLPPLRPNEKASTVAERNGNFQGALDVLDRQQRVIGAALKSKDPYGALSKIGDDHFDSQAFDNFYDQADPKTQALLDQHLRAVDRVLDAVKEATDRNRLDPLGMDELHASRPPTQLERDLSYLLDSGMTGRNLLEYIVRNGSTSVRRTIAARLLQLSTANPYTRFGTQAEARYSHPRFAQVFGDYHNGYDRIRIYDTADMEHTLLHEMVHAATIQALNKDPKLATSMGKLLRAARAQASSDERKHYGLTNIREFVAEAMSNPQFAKWLDSLTPPTGMKYQLPLASIWRSFKELLRRTFGFPKGAETLLDHVLHLGGEAIQTTNNVRASLHAMGAPGLEHETGLYARSVLDNGDKIVDDFNRRTDWRGIGTRIYTTVLGWRDGRGIVDGIERHVPSSRAYETGMNDAANISDKFNSLPTAVRGMFEALPRDTQNLVADLMRYTHLNIDPRLTWEKHTWLHNSSKRDGLKKEVQTANNKWNELKRKGGVEAYLAAHNTNRTLQFSAIVGLLREAVHNTQSKIQFTRDPFKDYQFKSDLHKDPRASADFWQHEAIAHTQLVRAYLSHAKDAISQETDPTIKQRLVDHIQVMQGAERDITRMLAALDQGPNFSLRRQGGWYVSGKLFSNFTPAHIERFGEALKAAGFGDVSLQPNADNNSVYIRVHNETQAGILRDVFIQMQNEDVLDKKQGITSGLASSLHENHGVLPSWLATMVEGLKSRFDLPEGADPALVAQHRAAVAHAIDQLTQQYLDMLPESSMSKIFTLREGVQGPSTDMFRAFVERASNTSRMLGNISTARARAQAHQGMLREVDNAKRNTDLSLGQQARIQQSVGEILLREALRNWQVKGGVFDNIRHVTHVMELGLSVPYTMSLLSQVPTLAWGELAKTHGFAKSAVALARVSVMALRVLRAAMTEGDKWTFSLTPDKLAKANIPKDVADFLLHQNNRGDFNLGSYTQFIYDGLHHTGPTATLHKMSGAWTLYSEMAPRLITALAARDLYNERPAQATKEYNDLHSFVSSKVNRSQMTWNPSMNPRAVGKHGVVGAASPLISQFMGYHMKLMEKLYREAADAMGARGPDQKIESRRFLMAHLAAMTAVSGTMGLPMVSWFAGLYDRLADFLTGDHTHDVRASYRSFLADTFGKGVGEAISHGLPRFAGVDLSRLGEDRILPGTELMTSKRKWEDAERDWVKSMAGSAFGLMSDLVLAARDINNGDFLEASAKAAPEFLRNMADATLIGKYGYTDKGGFAVPVSANGKEIMETLLGFTPAQKAEYDEERRVSEGIQDREQYDVQNVTQHLARSFNRHDPAGYAAWMKSSQEYMLNHPGLPPPAASFGQYLQEHARSAGMAGVLGTPVGTPPRDLRRSGMVSFGNLGRQ